jgi:glycosyltransferase involved in cell wall biosynthesis
MSKPLVSVICLCRNHAKYVSAAVESVLNQTYEHIELIVVDDTSTDNSKAVIEQLSITHSDQLMNVGFRSIFNDKNLGNCRSFNLALALAKGKYIVDLAADDLLLPDRISVGVDSLEKHGEKYGVHFCDVELINENEQPQGTHYKRNSDGHLTERVPEGDVFRELTERYFICTPSMMMSKKVLDELGGYDENLSYEDFDFWIRSSRNYKYAFSDKVLVKKRILADSLSAQQHKKKNEHIMSTAKVGKKAMRLIQNEEEKKALLKRIDYEMKWALLTENWDAANLLLQLKKEMGVKSIGTQLQKTIIALQPPLYSFLKLVNPLEFK